MNYMRTPYINAEATYSIILALFLEIEDSEEFTLDCLRQSEKWKHLISLVDEAAQMS